MKAGFLIGLLWILTGCLHVGDDADPIARLHNIHVSHPSFPQEQPVQKHLLVHVDRNNTILYYEMEVDSVFCMDTKCEVIPVRLYWDVLGQYKRFELIDGRQLTKKDHVVFTDEDYRKLDSILGDRRSFLKDLKSAQLVNPEKAVKTADGISAPTPASLQNAVVAGAAYTCYTLWHWANGEISERIRGLTSMNVSHDQLLQLYETGVQSYVEFAIEQLIERKAYDSSTLGAIVDRISVDEVYVKSALNYLTQLSKENTPDLYYESIEKAFALSGKTIRVRLLESLMISSLTAPASFYDRISKFLPDLESYYEVHLLLELESRYNPDSNEVNRYALDLLDNTNFLIARRAFWFLEERDLTNLQADVVRKFREQYKDRI